MTLRPRNDRGIRYLMRHEIAPSDACLAGRVSSADASGYHYQRREPIAIELERMVQPSPQDR